MKTKTEWKRTCPECSEEIPYTRKAERDRAEKRNTNCKSCANFGTNIGRTPWNKGIPRTEETKKKISESKKGCVPWNVGIPRTEKEKKKISKSNTGQKRSEETRKNISISVSGENNPMYGKSVYFIWLEKYGKKEAGRKQKIANEKMSESRKGKNNPMYGKSYYDIWLEKYGKKEADKRQKETNNKKSESKKGIPRTEEVKRKLRLTTLKRIEKNKFNGNQMSPNYNTIGCDIIRWYNMYYGFNFQHAENGGEVCVDGYYPDGVDEKRKTIIEIDEKHHFNPDGKLKQKDIQRQEYLEGLGYTFIRVKIYQKNS